jgi:hypothetical protein
MDTLDLHGVRHHKVELMVENFILLHDPPLRIITGNSPSMKSMVFRIVENYDFSWSYENDFNLGSIVVNAS